MGKFIAVNFVEMDNSKKMRATNDAFELCNKSFLDAGFFGKTEVILKHLNKSADFKNIQTIGDFSEDEVQKAYKKYTKLFSKGYK